jgi:hypothetical protein
MVGYSTHANISIRHRSSTFDVPLGAAPCTAFVNFETLEQAKAFIDAGRVVTDQVVYDINTQAPAAA